MTRLPLLLAASVLVLAGCSDDSAEPSSDGAIDTVSAPSVEDVGEDVGEAVEQLDGLEDGDIDDALGRTLVISVPGASDYELADGRITVIVDGTSADNPGGCLIAGATRDGAGSSVSLTIRYDDETVDCD